MPLGFLGKRRKQCRRTPKVPYATPADAVNAVWALRTVGMLGLFAPVGIFYCLGCKAWHWGNRNGRHFTGVSHHPCHPGTPRNHAKKGDPL